MGEEGGEQNKEDKGVPQNQPSPHPLPPTPVLLPYLHGVDECLGDGHSQGACDHPFLEERGCVHTAEEILKLQGEWV